MIIGINDPYTLSVRSVLAMERVGARTVGQPRELAFTNVFVRLPDVECLAVIFTNLTGKKVAVRRGVSGTIFVEIPDGYGKEIDVRGNADELYVKNAETSDSVTVTLEFKGEVVA